MRSVSRLVRMAKGVIRKSGENEFAYLVQTICSVMSDPKKVTVGKLTDDLHTIHVININCILIKHRYPDTINAEEVKVIRLFLNFAVI